MNEQDWDNVAASFDEDIFSVPAHDRKELILSCVKRFAKKDGTAADIGCGVGRTVPMLAEHFGRVYATDVSSQCLLVAERKYPQYSNVEYIHADLTEPIAEIPPVDFALCINVFLLESLAKRQAMMTNTCACVKPGGHLLLVTPSVESALYASFRLVQLNEARGMNPAVAQQKAARDASRMDMGVLMIDGVPTKHHLQEELHDLLTAQGMRVIDTRKIEYPWAYVLDEPPGGMPPPFPWNWMVVAQRSR